MAVTIGAIVLAIYLGVVTIRQKSVPESISATFYGAGGWWFTFVMIFEAICLLITMLDMSPDSWKWLAFLCGASLGFIGTSPFFRGSTMEHNVHYVSAYTFVVTSQMWVLLMAHIDGNKVVAAFACVWATALTAMILWRSRSTLIVELACIANIIISAAWLD